MNVRFLKTTSLSSAKHAGFAAALVCALAATGAGAHEQGIDGVGTELEYALEPIIKRQLSDDIVLAQHADDCGCDDAENYGDDEDFDEEHADDYGDERDDSQGEVLSNQERLDRNLDRQIQVIEKRILWSNPMGPGYF